MVQCLCLENAPLVVVVYAIQSTETFLITNHKYKQSAPTSFSEGCLTFDNLSVNIALHEM